MLDDETWTRRDTGLLPGTIRRLRFCPLHRRCLLGTEQSQNGVQAWNRINTRSRTCPEQPACLFVLVVEWAAGPGPFRPFSNTYIIAKENENYRKLPHHPDSLGAPLLLLDSGYYDSLYVLVPPPVRLVDDRFQPLRPRSGPPARSVPRPSHKYKWPACAVFHGAVRLGGSWGALGGPPLLSTVPSWC